MKLILRVHFAKDDPEFMSDYCSVDLLTETGTVIRSWQDAYHDDGLVKAEAFVAGATWAGKKIDLFRDNVADFDV